MDKASAIIIHLSPICIPLQSQIDMGDLEYVNTKKMTLIRDSHRLQLPRKDKQGHRSYLTEKDFQSNTGDNVAQDAQKVKADKSAPLSERVNPKTPAIRYHIKGDTAETYFEKSDFAPDGTVKPGVLEEIKREKTAIEQSTNANGTSAKEPFTVFRQKGAASQGT